MHSEQAFHDQQAGQRSATFRADPAALLVSDDAYLDHEPWIRPAFARLGDVSGLDVLDYGCGHGIAAVVLARRGARVTAFDLSAPPHEISGKTCSPGRACSVDTHGGAAPVPARFDRSCFPG